MSFEVHADMPREPYIIQRTCFDIDLFKKLHPLHERNDKTTAPATSNDIRV